MGYVVFSAFDGMSCGQIAFNELGIKVDKYYASEVDKYAIMQTQHNFPNTIQLGSIVDVDVSKLDPIDILIGGSPCQSFSFAGKRNGMTTVESEEIYTLDRYLELKSEGFQFEGQSYLFWEYMRILTDIRKYNPDVKFLLENVEMGDKWERVLSEAIGIFGVHINSALVSAQNRKRIYWTNIRVKEVGLFGELHSDIPQPKDEGILLKDILEEYVDEKYYLSDAAINRSLRKEYSKPQIDPDKTGTLNTKNNSGQCSFDSGTTFIKVDKSLNKKPNQEKASCFTAGGNSGGNHSDMDLICVAQRGRETSCLSPKRTEYGKQIRKDYEAGLITEQRKNIQQLEPRCDGKTNTITTVQKDNLICIKQLPRGANKGGLFHDKSPTLTSNSFEHNNHVLQMNVNSNDFTLTDQYLQINGGFDSDNRFYYENGKHGTCLSKGISKTGVVLQIKEATSKGYTEINPGECFDFENPKSKTRRGRRMDVKCNSLMAQNMSFMNYTKDYRIRRLTPTEASRLQTVPSWYEWIVSETQQYKMLGNGWTVKVIMHILKYLS